MHSNFYFSSKFIKQQNSHQTLYWFQNTYPNNEAYQATRSPIQTTISDQSYKLSPYNTDDNHNDQPTRLTDYYTEEHEPTTVTTNFEPTKYQSEYNTNESWEIGMQISDELNDLLKKEN